eukprot:TRINITY_DN15019_c0_g1_i1.p1 TRINITY_DN15019_c0_g1~~TRINITY_DN15019_c0_g1_i1.p1  ORF type:complete len:1020 (+),score=172.67 TRINITY_DN15019_c0_g1_i1:44-3061(+)
MEGLHGLPVPSTSPPRSPRSVRSSVAATPAASQVAVPTKANEDVIFGFQKKLMLPVLLFISVVLLFYSVFNALHERPMKATLWLAMSVLLFGVVLKSIRGGGCSQPVYQIAVLAVGFSAGICYDLIAYGKMETWVYLIVTIDALILLKSKKEIIVGVFIVGFCHVILRTVEDAERFGLYDLFPNENAYDLPEAIGWVNGINLLGNRLLMLGLTASVTYRAALAMQRQEELLKESVSFAEELAWAMGRLDLETCTEILEQTQDRRIPADLVQPFRKLLVNLHIYRRYLPETLFTGGRSVADKTLSVIMVNEGNNNNERCRIEECTLTVEDYDGSENPLATIRREAPENEETRIPALITMLERGVKEVRTTLMHGQVELSTCISDVISGFQLSCKFVTFVMDAVRRERGVVLELRADAVVSSWNSHQRCQRHAIHASRAANRVLRLSKMQSNRFEIFPWWGIALASGTSAVGHIGDERRRAPFVFGTATLHSHSLLQLSKALMCNVVAMESVQEQAQSIMDFRPIEVVPTDVANHSKAYVTLTKEDGIQKKGSEQQQQQQQQRQPINPLSMVYELRGFNPHPETVWERVETYYAAFMNLRQGNYSGAAKGFGAYLQTEPYDFQATRLLAVSQAAEAGTLKISKPYQRNFIGWGIHGKAEEEVILKSKEIQESNFNQVTSIMRSLASDGSEIELRHELERRQVEDEDGSSSSDRDVDLRMTFTDRAGTNWKRCEQNLGEDGQADVFLLIGDDGSLAVSKSVFVRIDQTDEQARVAVEAMMHEVGLLSTLHHDNVVHYLSSAVVGNHICTIMEYVAGGSLQSIVQRFGPIDTTPVRRYVKDILRGLTFLHRKGIGHRDLKPANILLGTDGVCKLADFGAAAELPAVAAMKTEHVIGTPPFIAPEACNCSIQIASDIWSLGVSVCFMVSGQVPFPLDEGPLSQYRFIHRMGDNSNPLQPAYPQLNDPNALSFLKSCLVRAPKSRPTAESLLYHSFLSGNSPVTRIANDSC